MSVHDDRLQSEHSAMKKFRSEILTWETVGGNTPPDKYHLDYKLKSITGFNKDNQPLFHTGFKIEVNFPPDYPRSKPDVRLISKPWPYHPNIWVQDGRFCLEGTQHWIPGIGVPLDSICQMVGEIIAFQEVYLQSPANANTILADWIRNNLEFKGMAKITNPIDPTPIRLPDVEDIIRWGSDGPAKPTSRIRFG